jgi:hypothetical protein
MATMILVTMVLAIGIRLTMKSEVDNFEITTFYQPF